MNHHAPLPNALHSPASTPVPADDASLECVSALVDGELSGAALQQAISLALKAPEGQVAWQHYHLLREVLHEPQGAQRATVAAWAVPKPAAQGDTDFVQGVMQRIAAEPAWALQSVPAQPVLVAHSAPAANDARAWKWLASCASVAAVVALGWNLWSPVGQGAGQGALQAAAPTLAVPATASANLSATPVAPAATVAPALAQASAGSEPLTMIRDPRLDELLAAHRQFAGTSALQAPAGFLRNATFEVAKP